MAFKIVIKCDKDGIYSIGNIPEDVELVVEDHEAGEVAVYGPTGFISQGPLNT